MVFLKLVSTYLTLTKEKTPSSMAEPFKNLYNEEYLEALISELQMVYPPFNANGFKAEVFDSGWSSRELKQRMRHISTTLGTFLPKNFYKSVKILENAFTSISSKFALENMIFQDFVEVYGVDDFENSMRALEVFTIGSSSEFAIRQFILRYPLETMAQMKIWSRSENEHIRRLSTEGCRPRLPWAIALSEFKKEPNKVIEILEILKDDESAYVRKSVANNLNDISKDNPHLVKEIAKEWLGKSKNRDSLIKHGCRTLLKASDRDILNLFGFRKTTDITIEEFKLSKIVLMGEELELSFRLNSQNPLDKLRVEYVMGFLRQNGTYSKKVFKVCEGEYKTSSKSIVKKHSFREISTRKYYVGVQKISIVINGDVFIEGEFTLG